MGRKGEDESFAAYAPASSGAAAAELGGSDDVAREIAKAMPWLKPEEIDALRKEQELIESGETNKQVMMDAATGAAFKSKSGEKEFADYVVDDTSRSPVQNTGSPRKLVDDSEYTESYNAKSDIKMSTVAKTGTAKTIYSRRGMQEEDESAKQIQAPATVGQWNVPSSGNRGDSGSDRVGAVAVEGPGGTNRALYGGGALSDNNRNQSLISAELVTEGEPLDTNQIRQMLRSELQAELQNNIVRAEVITPTGEAIASNDDVETGAPKTPTTAPTGTSSSEPPRSKKRCYIFAAIFVLIIGAAGGAAAGVLLAGGGNDDSDAGDANANIVGATDGPVLAPSMSPTVKPSLQVTFAPVIQPSGGEGQPPVPTQALPTLSPPTRAPPTNKPPTNKPPTNKPPDDTGGNNPPTLTPSIWPSQFPTTAPPPSATRPPTQSPTDVPTIPDPLTRAPTDQPTLSPTFDNLTPSPTDTILITPSPTDGVETTPAPTARPTDAQVEETDPPTREPTRPPTEEEEEVASPSSA